MDKEKLSGNEQSDGSGRSEWQSLGHKIAEQIASHTTVDRNGEAVYLGKELPEELQGKVEEAGFTRPAEQPRGTSQDGIVHEEVYPRNYDKETPHDYNKRIIEIKRNTLNAIEWQIEQRATNFLTDERIDEVYQNLIDEGVFRNTVPDESTKNRLHEEVREIIPNVLNRYYPYMYPHNNQNAVKSAYQKIYFDDLTKDEPNREIAKDELEREAIDQAIRESKASYTAKYKGNSIPTWKFLRESTMTSAKVLADRKYEIFAGLFDNHLELGEREIADAKRVATSMAIKNGSFLPNTITENPEKADEALNEAGVKKEALSTMWLAIEGLDKAGREQKQKIADYFDLNSRVAEAMDDPDCIFSYSNSGGSDKLFVCQNTSFFRRGAKTWRPLNPIITKGALKRLEDATIKIEEDVFNNSEFIEQTRDAVRKAEEVNVAKEVLRDDHGWLIGQLLDTAEVDCSDRILKHFIRNQAGSESFSKILTEYIDKNSRAGLKITTEVDNKEAVLQGLKIRLAQGIAVNGKNVRDLTEIFETQGYKVNEARIGLDFTDKTVMRLAFGGLINTLKATPKGQIPQGAEWYFDNIFMNDLGEFEAMAKQYGGNMPGGRKLFDFIRTHKKDFEEYHTQKEIDERLNNYDMDRQHLVRAHQITHLSHNGLKTYISQLKHKQLKKFQQNVVVNKNIATITGANIAPSQANSNVAWTIDETPFDFGVDKLDKLDSFAKYVEDNLPNSNVDRLTVTFPDGNGRDDADTYAGFCFDYEGKHCMIVESPNSQAAMYVAMDSPEGDFTVLDLFDNPKRIAESNSPYVASISHLRPENLNESWDETCRKAMLFFRTGDKRYAAPNSHKNYIGNRQWQQTWEQEFPAWPMVFDNGTSMPADDLASYQEWQERQMRDRER